MKNIKTSVNETLSQWRLDEKKALKLIKVAGGLRFDRGIELILFRKDIYDSRPSEIIHNHRFSKNYSSQPIDIDHTLDVATQIESIDDLAPSRIDIGKLAADFKERADIKQNLNEFLRDIFKKAIQTEEAPIQAKDIVLYGFGRIGRLLARRIIELTGRGDQLRLKAVVIRSKLADRKLELEKRAALLQSDSIHGEFGGSVKVSPESSEWIINGNRVKVIFANNPSEIDYKKHGIEGAMLIDNTGVWRDRAGLSAHLRPGIDQVLFTAPGKDIPNIVYGVNHRDLKNDENVFCAASCTTNVISPVLKVLNDKFGIESGHIETIHAYTSDQNLLDNFHKKPRRGRAAALNMVLTSTGAAQAVAKVLPELSGKLTGNAVRVPTPNVSLAVMNLVVKETVSVETINAELKHASLYGNMVEQIHYSSDPEYVSTHVVGTTSAAVFDAPSTIVSKNGKQVTVYAWYDNEYGYCCQVVRLAKYAAQVRRFAFY
nr:glyceraldehyde-3-phosphate dehydrogenase [Saprospiraceae bacterium]